jgi:hypothetical protein
MVESAGGMKHETKIKCIEEAFSSYTNIALHLGIDARELVRIALAALADHTDFTKQELIQHCEEGIFVSFRLGECDKEIATMPTSGAA